MNNSNREMIFSKVLSNLLRNNAIFIVLIGMVVILSIFVPTFGTVNNIINILRQSSALTIIAMGQYFVVLSGGIDLSAGSTISFITCLITGLMYFNEWSLLWALSFTLMISIFIGIINGVLVAYGNIQPFIVTLATMITIKGVAFIYSGGIPISGTPGAFEYFGRGFIGAIPFPIVLMLIIVGICYVFSEHTVTGRNIFYVGSNESATRLCGIDTKKVKLLVYIISSFLTSIGAVVIASRTMSGQPTVGEPMLFDILTAVVLGGTSLSGGTGKAYKVLVGALILGVIANFMVLIRVSPYWQWITRGIILVLAAFIDVKTSSRNQ